MFGPPEEDDADFLSPTGGARLASLFGLDQTAAGSGNEYFQYTAPKQPKKGQPAAAAGPPPQKPPAPATTSAPPSVFIATAVHAYRFTNGQYAKQGKYGAAVVGSHATREYRLLLYISQQQQMASARIHSGFVFTVQPNNYSTFYDDQRQNWSLLFESEKATLDFSKQVPKHRCHWVFFWGGDSGDSSLHSPDTVMYQDLMVGEGQGVEVGDALEVVFTGWLFQNSGLGQVFDSNVNKPKYLRLKLGSGKIIKGWEEGMLGMKKGGRRFLIIPPALAYGAQGLPNRIPPDATLAFEVDIKRWGKTGWFFIGNKSPELALAFRRSRVVHFCSRREVPPRLKASSVSEPSTNPEAAKAKLISRMAKMGQPMLPFLPGTAQAGLDSSDSEIEDPNTLRGTAPPVAPSPLKSPSHAAIAHVTTPVPAPANSGLPVPAAAILPAAVQAHPAVPGTMQSFQPYAGMAYAHPQATTAATQLQPVGTLYPAPFQAGDIGSFLMTEARQQNTEIRLAVGKVADKIDQLAFKMEELQKQNSGHTLLPGFSSVTMETAMITSNIQRILQENERLKQEVFEKSGRIEEQNEKISELIARNQRYVEQSNLLMEQRNSSLQLNTEHTQARVLHAEQEKVKVVEELALATAQISRLQLELTERQKKETGLRSQLNAALKEAEGHGAQVDRLQAQLAELRESSEEAKTRYQTEKQSRKQLEGKVAAWEEELTDLRAEKENLEKMSLMQTELESQWEAKCERLLSLAKEQHACQYQEVCEQRDAQGQVVAQLEEKISQLKATRSLEDEKLSVLQDQLEQLEPVKEKVKKVMNGVFRSLRGQFELEEPYLGKAVLGVVMNTIKTVTLQLLQRQEEAGKSSSQEERSHPAPVQRTSPGTPDGGAQNVFLSQPPETASSAQTEERLEKESDDSPLSPSPEGPRAQPLPAALDARDEQPPLAAESPPVVEKEQEEEKETDASEQLEAGAEDEIAPSVAVDGQSETPTPVADEAGTPLVAAEGGGDGSDPAVLSPDPPVCGPLSGDGDMDSPGTQPESGPSPVHVDSSSIESRGGLPKAAACKPSASGRPPDEDEEDEPSLKGRPPPTPSLETRRKMMTWTGWAERLSPDRQTR
ncbi:hypothetical protein JRQ81_008554 [Phrynocephalus forsythii]|uniref:peptidylprolyl isomerase n=1 Tax=Phrynocephalus forsythii TaxID=171643 RepID=A0A9Q0XB87_9SAUR|nr:hypothetical protein JRQ81_008554 [Phrynocephalus forsythii]